MTVKPFYTELRCQQTPTHLLAGVVMLLVGLFLVPVSMAQPDADKGLAIAIEAYNLLKCINICILQLLFHGP